MLKVLDLFSGIGGFSLGLERTGGFETVAFCEIEPFCQKVLKKHWPTTPIYNDVRELDYDGSVDVITGGYPCQPFSTAGKRKGEFDPRHLWPAMFGIIRKHRPRWIIGENVAGHVSMGLDEVLADLEGEAYEAIPFIIPACALGAPHRRDRIWIIASDTAALHSNGGYDHTRISARAESFSELGNGCGQEIMADSEIHAARGLSIREKTADSKPCFSSEYVANAAGIRQPRPWEFEQRGGEKESRGRQTVDVVTSGIGRFWEAEPAVGRVVNGLSKRLDTCGESAAKPTIQKAQAAGHIHRLTSLGNAVVPWIPYLLGNYILEVEEIRSVMK